MKKILGIAIGMMVLGMVAIAQGEDCPGTSWRSSGGRSCRDLGLDSQRGTCLPGDRYETLCDDSQQGIKTCPGPRSCQEEEVYRGRRHEGEERYRDDHGDRRYEREGRYRDDHGDRSQKSCYYWDFDNNRPCQRGYINLDCKSGCDSRE